MIDCKRAVSEREAQEAASRLGVDYIEASSLESINIDKVNVEVNKLMVIVLFIVRAKIIMSLSFSEGYQTACISID